MVTQDLALTEEDIFLLQLALLFHDSERQNDGEDMWDQDSALTLYRYLIDAGAPPEKAKLIAEAMANKDAADDNYFELDIKELTWKKC